MTPLARALLEELSGDPDAMRELAGALAPYLPQQVEEPDRWMTSAEAARYLSMSKHGLHKLTAARSIPFEQAGTGCKVYLKRSELDAWRAAGGASQSSHAGTTHR